MAPGASTISSSSLKRKHSSEDTSSATDDHAVDLTADQAPVPTVINWDDACKYRRPPISRDDLILMWRAMLPTGSTRAIPQEIEEVPYEYWWGSQHFRYCNCRWCNVLYGVGLEREHI